MGREKRDFKRPEANKDASLFVIATEGEVTEYQYFTQLADKIRSSKIHIEVIEKLNTNSDPKSTMKLLDKFKSEYNLRNTDELWLVIDRDKHDEPNHIQNLTEVARMCSQKNYNLALSNPCFEIWFIFHKTSLDSLTQDEKENLFENKKNPSGRTQTEIFLVSLYGHYNKTNIDIEVFFPDTEQAIINAKLADTNPTERWQNSLGTRVYLIVERLLAIT
jgi:hypothetical protein